MPVPTPLDRVHTVAIIDDHEAPMRGVAAELGAYPAEFEVVAQSATVDEHLAGPGGSADLVVLDLYLDHDFFIGDRVPDLVGRGSRVVAFTSEERPYRLRQVVELGASGLVLKSDPLATVVTVLREVARGGFACGGVLANALLTHPRAMAMLAPREREALELLDAGLTRRQAAHRMGIEPSVIGTYLSRVRDAYREIGVEPDGNTHGLTSLARDEGQLGGPPGPMGRDFAADEDAQ